MNENTDPAILVKDIKRNYGRIEALSGVNMQVEKGTIFGLLGSNGAGKTTLIKVLVGSTRPNQGHVRVLGLDPFKDAQRLRGLIGYMPQAPALYEDLSARDNIAFFGEAHLQRRRTRRHLSPLDRQVNQVLEFTGLAGRAGDAVAGFSGGMKQRVSLACALVHRPQALFLDEPTAGVDTKLKEVFWQHFRQMAAQGITLFISTHLMDEALLCDRLAIMRDGAVLICDTPKNIMLQGNTTVKIWRGDKLDQQVITKYSTELPALLRNYGMDPAVTRLELEQDTLETIMLRLIGGKTGPDETGSTNRPVV